MILLLIILVFAFELINRNISESGFSSGEVFDFSFEHDVFYGEIFGRKFSANLSPLIRSLPYLENLLLFLPPFVQLILCGAVFLFGKVL